MQRKLTHRRYFRQLQQLPEVNQTPQTNIFTSEEFGEVRTIIINGEPWFVGKDVCKAFGDTNHKRSLSSIDDSDRCISKVDTTSGKQSMVIINESGLYSLLFQMQPKKAKGVSQNAPLVEERTQKLKRFKRWVTSEVLPTIRKTGGYVLNDELFISEYLPFADDTTKLLFQTTLQTIRSQNNLLIEKQKELDYRQEVIYNLTDEITVSDKRQILNRIMRHHNGEFQDRWYLLYREFDNKYNMNVNRRLENYNKKHKPQIKSKLDYIDKVLNQLDDLYDLAAKLYESDVNELINQLYKARGLQLLN